VTRKPGDRPEVIVVYRGGRLRADCFTLRTLFPLLFIKIKRAGVRITRGIQMKFSKPVLMVAAATALNFPALSAIAEEQSPIIVTATRTAQTADESLASVTVITAKQIEQQQPNDLRELLTAISGIDMTNNGGTGKATSMFMRGTSSSHVLVMIDGIKVGSATSGSIAFQHIPVSQIERIEIVRGPRSSLYGSEAIGGVIQIFTKKGNKEQANLEMGYGSYATSNIAAGISQSIGDTTYSLNAAQLKTNGFDAKDDTETDNDGYSNNSVSFNLSHKLSDSSSLQLNTLHANGSTEYDGSSNNSKYVQQTSGLQYTARPLKNWNIKINASESLDESDNFSDLTFKSRFNTRRTSYTWQNDIDLNNNQILTVGLDYQNDSVVSTTVYNETSRNNTAGYIQHQWNGDKNDIQYALRNDNNQAFGSHVTGNLAWGHDFSKTFRLISSYGTAFRAPTFNQLYYPDTGFGGGDPTLKPEYSKTAEIELRKKHSWGDASFSFYNTQIDNLISGWPPSNVNKAQIDGVEIRVATKLAGWDTQAEISVLDPRDTTTNKILQRRAQKSFRLNMDKTSGKWSTGLSIIAQGYRYDDTSNNTKLNGYSLINLRASYAVTDKMSIKWKIDNLLDAKYETVSKYNNPGASAYISIVYRGF